MPGRALTTKKLWPFFQQTVPCATQARGQREGCKSSPVPASSTRICRATRSKRFWLAARCPSLRARFLLKTWLLSRPGCRRLRRNEAGAETNSNEPEVPASAGLSGSLPFGSTASLDSRQTTRLKPRNRDPLAALHGRLMGADADQRPVGRLGC